MSMHSYHALSRKENCIDNTLLGCKKYKIKGKNTDPHQQMIEIMKEKD